MRLLAEQTLVDCLDLLEKGESVEEILVHYPESAAALRPFLTAAVYLSQLTPQPTLATKQKSQQQFLQRAAELRAEAADPSPWLRLRRALMPLASLAVILLIVGVTLITASASAVPGDTLYGAKRLFEEIRLTRTGDVEILMEQIQEERVREVETILQTERDEPVAFEGSVNDIQPGNWLIADIAVRVDRFTRIEGTPEIGSRVRVNGRTHDGILRAVSMTILSNDPQPVETRETPVPANSPTPSPVPNPTMTPTPTETAPPDDNDNNNDNSGDDNDNGSDDNTNDNSDEDNTNDNSSDNNANDNNDDDNTNDNGSDDNANDNSDDDNTNDNGSDDNANDNSDDDNTNDSGGDDNANDNSDDDTNNNDNNDDNSGHGGDHDDNDNSGNSGSGGGRDG